MSSCMNMPIRFENLRMIGASYVGLLENLCHPRRGSMQNADERSPENKHCIEYY